MYPFAGPRDRGSSAAHQSHRDRGRRQSRSAPAGALPRRGRPAGARARPAPRLTSLLRRA